MSDDDENDFSILFQEKGLDQYDVVHYQNDLGIQMLDDSLFHGLRYHVTVQEFYELAREVLVTFDLFHSYNFVQAEIHPCYIYFYTVDHEIKKVKLANLDQGTWYRFENEDKGKRQIEIKSRQIGNMMYDMWKLILPSKASNVTLHNDVGKILMSMSDENLRQTIRDLSPNLTQFSIPIVSIITEYHATYQSLRKSSWDLILLEKSKRTNSRSCIIL